MLATTVESSVITQEELQTLRRRKSLLLQQHLVRLVKLAVAAPASGTSQRMKMGSSGDQRASSLNIVLLMCLRVHRALMVRTGACLRVASHAAH